MNKREAMQKAFNELLEREGSQFGEHQFNMFRKGFDAALASQAQQKPVSKDWAEDFAHENGMYQIICCVCECAFIGHKRRVICKACAQQPAPEGE